MTAARATLALVALLLVPAAAHATVIHIVRPGDSVTGLAMEYYGQPGRDVVLRAVNRMPPDGDVVLAIGEPIVIPEVAHRVVREGDTWESIALEELGTTARAPLLAEANGTTIDSPPGVGRILVIPYLMPLVLGGGDGLPVLLERYYPGQPPRAMVRLLRDVNPNLRGRVPGGTRIVVPYFDLTILPTKRRQVEQSLAQRRDTEDLERQEGATDALERLESLLAEGSYVELVVLASRTSGSFDLTAPQRITIHRYLAQAFVALDREDLAELELETLLGIQPDFQLDQVTTSPRVLEVLERARRRARSTRGPRP